jgi:hypothetical protein
MLAGEDDDHVLAVDDVYVPARREQPRDRPRHDVWTVFALRAKTGLTAGADPNAVITAVGNRALASGAIAATYSRQG